MPETKETISLYYREGASDKVYHAQLEPSGSGWVVNFQFGRRGSTLQTGTKTSTPVPYDKAKKAYEKVVAEKMAKGYTPGADGTPYVATDKAGKVSGVLPQLLNMIDEAEAELLAKNSTHCAQEKFDGRRTMVRKNGAVEGINRKGLLVPLAQPIEQAAATLPGNFVLDGEAIGDVLYVFDLLERDGDIRHTGYRERYDALKGLLGKVPKGFAIQLVPTAWTPKEKRQMLERLKKENREGIVFKEVDAPYKVGRPNAGGTQLKHKFYATASVVVTKVNAQRSVAIGVYDDSSEIPTPVGVGNVTIPANQPIPTVGQVLEVRYLYAYKGGSLFQPTSLGVRTDVEPGECLVKQLKYKPEGGDDDEA